MRCRKVAVLKADRGGANRGKRKSKLAPLALRGAGLDIGRLIFDRNFAALAAHVA